MLTKSTLPGKLADCTSTDKAISEIFVVEGDSAGMRAWRRVVHASHREDKVIPFKISDSGPHACMEALSRPSTCCCSWIA